MASTCSLIVLYILKLRIHLALACGMNPPPSPLHDKLRNCLVAVSPNTARFPIDPSRK